ncbi:MAG: ABC transporter ATP-binding protein [Rhodospirillales bacterium]|nr:ABC transporter ATP-binding protein [Rhodospirillales bacterium]
MSAILEARKVGRVLHEGEVPVTLLRDVSLSIMPGEFVSITGPSGSGKSSLLYILGLLDQCTSGAVYLNGLPTDDLGSASLSRMRLEHLGFVFQFHFLLPEFTILENVRIPMQRLGRLSERDQKDRATHLLEQLGLGDQGEKRPAQLSGGQRQRAAIARALANAPAVILADEPTGNLDTKNGRIVHDIFKGLARNQNTAIVMVTHDQALAATTDRQIHLVDGTLDLES